MTETEVSVTLVLTGLRKSRFLSWHSSHFPLGRRGLARSKDRRLEIHSGSLTNEISHTSDWHAGRTLRGRSRLEEHEAVRTEVLDIAVREIIDCALLTGDLFDSKAPSPDLAENLHKTPNVASPGVFA